MSAMPTRRRTMAELIRDVSGVIPDVAARGHLGKHPRLVASAIGVGILAAACGHPPDSSTPVAHNSTEANDPAVFQDKTVRDATVKGLQGCEGKYSVRTVTRQSGKPGSDHWVTVETDKSGKPVK